MVTGCSGDISPLFGLIKLRWLNLSSNKTSDISAVSSLTSLISLPLQGNGISDISALSGLTNPPYVYLIGNDISDIYPLVENDGLSEGDSVELYSNPLSLCIIEMNLIERRFRPC